MFGKAAEDGPSAWASYNLHDGFLILERTLVFILLVLTYFTEDNSWEHLVANGLTSSFLMAE